MRGGGSPAMWIVTSTGVAGATSFALLPIRPPTLSEGCGRERTVGEQFLARRGWKAQFKSGTFVLFGITREMLLVWMRLMCRRVIAGSSLDLSYKEAWWGNVSLCPFSPMQDIVEPKAAPGCPTPMWMYAVSTQSPRPNAVTEAR